MDGQVKAGLTYEDWLKGKTADEQDEVLGKGKADLWRRGVITFRDMLDQSGRPMSLRDLQQAYTKTWIPDDIYQRISKEVKASDIIQALRKTHGLTHHETVAIKAYTSHLYGELNKNLRLGTLSTEDKHFIAVLNQGLAKLPSETAKTFRDTTLPPEILDRYQVGKLVTEKAFTSSTLNTDLATFKGNVRFIIEGKNGKLIEQISDYPEEREVLFKDKSKFAIKNRYEHNGIVIIEMLEL